MVCLCILAECGKLDDKRATFVIMHAFKLKTAYVDLITAQRKRSTRTHSACLGTKFEQHLQSAGKN